MFVRKTFLWNALPEQQKLKAGKKMGVGYTALQTLMPKCENSLCWAKYLMLEFIWSLFVIFQAKCLVICVFRYIMLHCVTLSCFFTKVHDRFHCIYHSRGAIYEWCVHVFAVNLGSVAVLDSVHRDQEKMAAILQITCSISFSWMEIIIILFRYHWNSSPWGFNSYQAKIGSDCDFSASSHYLKLFGSRSQVGK